MKTQLYRHRSVIPNVFFLSFLSAIALLADTRRSIADPSRTYPVVINMAAAWSDSSGACSFSTSINGNIEQTAWGMWQGAAIASVDYDYASNPTYITETAHCAVPVKFWMSAKSGVPVPELEVTGIQFSAHVRAYIGTPEYKEYDQEKDVGLRLDVSSPAGSVSWKAKDSQYSGTDPQRMRGTCWWIREDTANGNKKFLVSQVPTANDDAIFVDPDDTVIDNDREAPTVTYTITWAYDPDPGVFFVPTNHVVTVGVGPWRTSEKPGPAGSPVPPFRCTATLYPQAKADAVTFDTSNSARATVKEDSRRASPYLNGAVDVILEVEGVTQTPAQSPDGDTEVRALYKGRTLETEKVLVVVPAAIHSPPPEFIGTATIASQALDAHTSPGVTNVPAGSVALTYTYLTNLTITVDDQFGNTIHPIYAGAAVTEYGDIQINQVLSPEGTYSDPVGVADFVKYEPINDPSGNPNPKIKAFVSTPPPPPQPNQQIDHQTIHVEVEGHVLGQPPEPAIKDRVVVFTPPDQLMITWP